MADREEPMTFQVDNARLIYKNFQGRATPLREAGKRTFSVVLDHDTAMRMAADGWNAQCKMRGVATENEGEEQEELCHIEVKVSYKVKPPKIVIITDTARTQLGEDEVGILDDADILHVDLICNAYNWEVGGKTGISAYLKTMFVTINEDPLEKKYAQQEVASE